MPSSLPTEVVIDFVIGIDFGVCFTGVAYSHGSQIKDASSQKRDLDRFAETTRVINTWPHSTQLNQEKTRTAIAYNTNPPTWGRSVKPHHKPQPTIFPLHRETNNAVSSLNYDSGLGDKQRVDIVTDYLERIRKFVLNDILPRHFGREWLNNVRTSFVIAVPLWTQPEIGLLDQAASQAGFPADSYTIITDAQAAATYCTTVSSKLPDGNIFFICSAEEWWTQVQCFDTISGLFFHLEELSGSSKSDCGEGWLREAFMALIQQKLGTHSANILTSKRSLEALRHFDIYIKCQFNPYEDDCDEEYEICLAGAPDTPDVGLKAGYLILKKEEINSIFIPIFEQVLVLIEKHIQQVTSHNRKIQTLFLVGELGSYQYLFQFLQQRLKNAIDVIKPMGGSSAVMRGAVLYGVSPGNANMQVMQKSYGIICEFRSDSHLESPIFTNPNGVEHYRHTIHWYAIKGLGIPKDALIEHSIQIKYTPHKYELRSPVLEEIAIYESESSRPSKYKDNSVTRLCSFKIDLRKLLLFKLIAPGGPKVKYYQADYKLGLVFGEDLVVKVMSEANEVASITVKYK